MTDQSFPNETSELLKRQDVELLLFQEHASRSQNVTVLTYLHNIKIQTQVVLK